MTSGSLAAAYAPFAASLLAGGFGPPAGGEWSAELVAAHIVRSNDLIAEAAEKVAAGADVAIDNASSVDETELARLAGDAGGLTGLAREIERSAARLERAHGALGDLAATPVHVIIRDAGEIARDGAVPIGAFINGHASAHLGAHHEQLKALGPAWSSGPPPDFDSCQLVLLIRAQDAAELDEEAAESLQRQHLGHFAKMRAAGYLSVAGPVRGDDSGDNSIAGICIYRAGTPERARMLAEDDPAVRAGRFEVRVLSWLTAKGALGGDS
jgi:uncharacterized protein YciI